MSHLKHFNPVANRAQNMKNSVQVSGMVPGVNKLYVDSFIAMRYSS
jgi:hypothetical protein